MKIIDTIACILLIIGGLNLGLIGFFGFDFFGMIFMDMVVLTRLIYCLIGIAAIYELVMWKSIHHRAKKK